MRTLLRALLILVIAIGIGFGVYAVIQPINASVSLSSGANPTMKGGPSTGRADAISAAAPWSANGAPPTDGIAHRGARPQGGGIAAVLLVLGKFLSAFVCVAVLRFAARKLARRRREGTGPRRGARS